MKALSLFILLLLFSSQVYAQVINNQLQYNKKSKSTLKKVLEKTSLSYFMNFSGPTLKSDRSDTTFNKFQTGFDAQGRELKDGTHALNAFHALAINYYYNSNVSFTLSYAYDTFHSSNVNYISSDGNTYTRQTKGVQYNPRFTIFLPNFYQNSYFSLSSGIGTEIPITPISRENGLDGALILTPSLSLKRMPEKVYAGVTTLIERYFYSSEKDVIRNNSQTFTLTVAPYFNYQLSNKWQFQSRMDFDWDQKGALSKTNTLSNNMVNTYRLGIARQVNNHLNWGTYLQAVLDNTKAETTIVGAFLGLRL